MRSDPQLEIVPFEPSMTEACERILAALPEWFVELFHVKTLGPSDPYPPYARTRAFYRALGFRALFETTALWGPENPALIMAKPL